MKNFPWFPKRLHKHSTIRGNKNSQTFHRRSGLKKFLIKMLTFAATSGRGSKPMECKFLPPFSCEIENPVRFTEKEIAVADNPIPGFYLYCSDTRV